MSQTKVFYPEETPTMPGHYIIRMRHEKFYMTSTKGSFNVIMARLMGLSYADFLRLCRDEYGAVIIGKTSHYPVAYFAKRGGVDKLCNELNGRANLVIFEKEHPDYPAHRAVVLQHDADKESKNEH